MRKTLARFRRIDCVGGTCKCQSCGKTIALPNAFTGVGMHTCQAARALGLGDRIASVLQRIGITKARAQNVAQAVGIKDCGCAKRQAALNRLGEKLGLPPGQTPPAN